MNRGFQGSGAGPLARALARLDALVNLERADRSAGSPGAQAIQRVDLEPARDLLRRLGNPERRFRAVHVTGTKGKGSVCAQVAAGLEAAGVRTGLYTSPHVERVNERVVLGGAPSDDGTLARHLERALDARDAALEAGTAGGHGSWFDTLTAAAFDAFAAEGVAWAVVEVGLGGRLDSTNALDGEVCVVTNIALEHTAILGDTRAAIAAEKAGIFKRGAALLTGVAAEDGEAGPPLLRAASEVGGELVHVPQAGTLMERNGALARAVLEELRRRGVPAIAAEHPGRGGFRLPGRLERRRLDGIPVVLDGAHVPTSLSSVLDDLEGELGDRGPAVAVLGIAPDKDAGGLLKALRGRVDRVLCTSKGSEPTLRPEELLRVAGELGVTAEAVVGPEDALRAAVGRAQPGGWVLVTGSLHLIGAVRGLLPTVTEDFAC